MSEKINKEFVLRESRLTELFESNRDMRSAFNLCFSIVVLLFGTTISYYLIDKNEFYSDLSWLNWCFGAHQFHLLLLSWLKMQLSALIILYPVLRLWLWSRTKNQSIISYAHNCLLTSFEIFYHSFLFWFALNFVHNNDVSPVCSFALLIEQIRLNMKIHSFIKENRHRNDQVYKDHITSSAPTLSQFVYFLNAPTFIYRDNYVRTDRIRWKVVFWYFLQVLTVMFVTFALSWRFVEHNYKLTGIKAFEIKHLIYLVLSGSLIGIQMMLLMFYGLLHCWLNAFAEMLRFGDRQFYNDWWNASDFVTYYRKWNVVVHEWLRIYVFNPSLKATNGNRGISALLVFLLSAVVHEYLLAVPFRFFLPVLFCFFFILGVMLFFIGKIKFKDSDHKKLQNNSEKRNGFKTDSYSQTTSQSFGNIFMFLCLTLGWGLMVMLYSMEWYSRINCPISDKSFLSYILPRLLSCVTIE